jgi:multicomponent Na+:H+ antiporter subunit G
MMIAAMLNGLTILLLLAGAFFFMAGTVGVLRFPDLLSRLHAVTKADNLGLGLIVAGLALQSQTPTAALKLLLIWLLVLIGSAVTCFVVANASEKARRGRERVQ